MTTPSSPTDADVFWMRRALAEAERGRGAVEPNPMVGAVVVRDGRFLACGHHERFGGPHAEVLALAASGDGARGAALYVTLEPCRHVGKTPPCTDAVLAAGVARVVIAMTDPFPKVSGGGIEQLIQAGLEVVVGVEQEGARRLNAPYLKRIATGRPYVTAKWAMTLDGRIATANGDSRWISGERSRAAVHETRGRMDAVIVGIGTILADDPQLNARPPGPRVATRVVLDSDARLPLTSQIVRSAREIPVWVAVSGQAPADRIDSLASAGCRTLAFEPSGRIPIRPLLDALGHLGDMSNVLVEGGGRVLGAFFDAGEVDAVDVFIAPRLVGGPPVHAPAIGRGLATIAEALRLERSEVSVLDGDVRIRGTIERP